MTKTARLPDGRPLYLSIDDFIEAMESGDSCFLCLRPMDKVGRSREHVIPKWLLRRHKLFSEKIAIGDQTSLVYGTHTVPCCPSCNALLGREIEDPISRSVLKWPQQLQDDIGDSAFRDKLFCWLSLLHFKSIYKDIFVTRYDSSRKSTFQLGEGRNWFIHHHVNSLCRLSFPELTIDPKAIGSMAFFILPEGNSFDFTTIHETSTIMIRLGRVAIVAALNDSCGALSIFSDTLGDSMPERPLDILDIKEIFGHITLINEFLEERPQYFTLSNIATMRAHITVTLPSKGARCIYDRSNPEHLEMSRVVWNHVYGTYKSQMTKEELSYLEAGTLSYLARKAPVGL